MSGDRPGTGERTQPPPTWPSAPLIPADVLAGWQRLWVVRSQPYALQRADGTYRWVQEACDADVLRAHLMGDRTLALASTDARGWCQWVCLDADSPAPETLAQLVALAAALGGCDIPAFVEASRRGGHVWILLDEATPAGPVRFAVYQAVQRIAAAGVALPEIELYPSTSAADTLGQAVRLPLGVHRLTGQHYPLLDAHGRPLAFPTPAEAVAWVLDRPRYSARAAQAAWTRWTRWTRGNALAAPPVVPRVILPTAAGALPAALAPKLSVERLDTPNTPTGSGHGNPGSQGTGSPGSQGTGSPGSAQHQQQGRRVGTRSAVIRWVDAQISPLDLLDELAPAAAPRRMGQGYLAWCPFHDDQAGQVDGSPGTPSLYVVRNQHYGWSWRCLSTNCPQHAGPMRHSFRLWQELLGTDAASAVRAAARRWCLAEESGPDHGERGEQSTQGK